VPPRSTPPPHAHQVTMLGQLIAEPENAATVEDAILRLVEPTRRESGNVSYDVHQLKTNPGAFYVLGNWADQAALDAHLGSTHLRTFLADHAARRAVAPPTMWRARMRSEFDHHAERDRPVGGSPEQVTLIPFFTVRPGQEDAVARCLLDMVEPTRAEPGCLGYDLYQSVEDPSVMFLHEVWADQKALDRHMNTPDFYRILRGRVDGRLAAPWTAHTMTMISEPERERIPAF
jgi:quinol monooxygenase YgiN